ncbi:VWA domain-containing protein [Miltoncostaea oceani]|uniref:VWA domain-containing protein n=1 Tax=Miltoncostaea oceani TaxID=2843216 RepID=UPI001C3E1AE3|nr:VWA domain-containing protein [Miltoncostaea oceani]
MSPARIITLALAALLIIGGLIVGLSGGGGPGGAQPASPGSGPGALALGGGVVVDLAYSPEKELLLAPLLERFNASGVEVAGKPVQVRGQVVSSGDAAARIVDGRLTPTLWSPSSSLWGRLVNHRADAALVPDENSSLVRTPLVIAMPEPMARALGWPDTPLGWQDILAEATGGRGWAAHGHPEWGRFKFGQTNPDFSTSGLSATAAEYLVGAQKSEGLTLADVTRPKVRKFVSGIQSSVVHYGDTTLFFAEQLKTYGPTYVSAIAMEEATLIDYNTRLASDGQKLVAIYPKEGTFWSDNPLIIPDAPWVDEEEREGARLLVEFLTAEIDPGTAGKFGFRPSDPDVAAVAPVSAANGVNPAEPTRLLSLPEPKVLSAILDAWRADRKPARIEVVLDISGSMNDGGKLRSAKEGLVRFLELLQPRDEVSLSVFSDRPTVVQEPVSMEKGRAALISRIRALGADGGTAVYDATAEAATRINATADDSRISAVVVLTDGADNESSLSAEALRDQLSAGTGSEGRGVRIFTIAYGDGAEKDTLEAIAKAGAGRAYSGDPTTIERVYIQISSFF